jgi:hypothetical protein
MAKKLLETGDRELVEVSICISYANIDTSPMLTAMSRRLQRIVSGAWDSAQQMLRKTEANGARTG